MTSIEGSILDGRYRVGRHVGSGGFGDVHEGVRLGVGTKVAIKLLHGDELSQEDRSARVAALLEEARMLGRLRDRNIVEALDAGVSRDGSRVRVYLVLEWCPGITLRQWMTARRAPVPVRECVEIVGALAEAMAHAHTMGIAHRDLKPTNVMLDESGDPHTLRILDFGIAKVFDVEGRDGGSGQTRTASPTSPHTPGYASPEQVVGARTGPWTDVHALALLFVELVTGSRVYGTSPTQDAVAVTRPTPSTFGVDVGPIELVLARALALRPRDRYRDARELHDALRESAAALGIVVAPVRMSPTSAASPPAPEDDGPMSRTVPSARGGHSRSRPIDDARETVRSARGAALAAARASREVSPSGGGSVPPTIRAVTLAPPRRPSRRAVLVGAGGVAALAFAGIAVYVARGEPAPRPPATLAQLDLAELERRMRKVLGEGASLFVGESWDRGVHQLSAMWGAGSGYASIFAAAQDDFDPVVLREMLAVEASQDMWWSGEPHVMAVARRGDAGVVVRGKSEREIVAVLEAIIEGLAGDLQRGTPASNLEPGTPEEQAR